MTVNAAGSIMGAMRLSDPKWALFMSVVVSLSTTIHIYRMTGSVVLAATANFISSLMFIPISLLWRIDQQKEMELENVS